MRKGEERGKKRVRPFWPSASSFLGACSQANHSVNWSWFMADLVWVIVWNSLNKTCTSLLANVGLLAVCSLEIQQGLWGEALYPKGSLQDRRNFLRIRGNRGKREARVACEGRIAKKSRSSLCTQLASRSSRFRLCSPEIRKKSGLFSRLP